MDEEMDLQKAAMRRPGARRFLPASLLSVLERRREQGVEDVDVQIDFFQTPQGLKLLAATANDWARRGKLEYPLAIVVDFAHSLARGKVAPRDIKNPYLPLLSKTSPRDLRFLRALVSDELLELAQDNLEAQLAEAEDAARKTALYDTRWYLERLARF